MFNNFQVLFIYYLLFGLTDFVRDLKVRREIGFWLTLLVTFFILFNLTWIIKTVIVKTKEAYKKKKNKLKVQFYGKNKEGKKFAKKQSESEEIEAYSDGKSFEIPMK